MPRARRWEALAAAIVAAAIIGWLLLAGGPTDAPRAGSGSEASTERPGLTGGLPPNLSAATRDKAESESAGERGDFTSSTPTPEGGTKTVTRAAPSPRSTANFKASPTTTGVIAGRVVLADGTPVPNQEVAVRAFDDQLPGRIKTTNARGEFTAQVTAPTWYRVATSGGLQEQPHVLSDQQTRVFVPASRQPVRVVLTLQPHPTLRFVPAPGPKDRVLLEVSRPFDRHSASQSPKPLKADGVMPTLEAATYDVTYFASRSRTSFHRIALQPGENTVSLDLKGPGRVVVDARNPSDEQVEVRVRFQPIGRTILYSELGMNEAMRRVERVEFTIRRDREVKLPAGRYLVTTLSSPTGLDAPSTEITVAPEQRLVVPLGLRPATTVEVQLDRPWPTGGGKILGRAGWSVEEPTRRGDPLRILRVAKSDTDTLLVRLGDLVGETQISAGTRPFLRLEPCGSVRLQVKRGDLDDSAKTFVEFTYLRPLVELTRWRPGNRTGPPVVPTWTDADGRVTQKLYPGRWKLEAEGQSVEVTVPTRITVDATLQLRE